MIDTLVQGGADPTVTDEEGRTCLHVASMSGHAAICAFLINECQLDPNQRDLGGRTPLHTAVYSLDVATTEALIAAGADVDAQDGEGISALHWAASRGSVGCLDLLLEASCFPNHTECVLLQFLYATCPAMAAMALATHPAAAPCIFMLRSVRYHHERLTALDYALMSEHDSGDTIAKKLRDAGGLTVLEVRQLAAQHIQSWWNGYRARTTLLSAWMKHQQSAEGSADPSEMATAPTGSGGDEAAAATGSVVALTAIRKAQKKAVIFAPPAERVAPAKPAKRAKPQHSVVKDVAKSEQKSKPKRYVIKKKGGSQEGSSAARSPTVSTNPSAAASSTSRALPSRTPARNLPQHAITKRQPLPKIGEASSSLPRKVVATPSHDASGPSNRKQKPRLHKKRLIKPPHHVATLGYYAQAMRFEAADVIDQGRFPHSAFCGSRLLLSTNTTFSYCVRAPLNRMSVVSISILLGQWPCR